MPLKTILKILEYAMMMEKQGQQFYLTYKDEVEGERFQEIFASLAGRRRTLYSSEKTV